MRKVSLVLAASVALMGSTAMVSAADLIVEEEVIAVETYDATDWSGLYIGLHLGVGAGQIGEVEDLNVNGVGGGQTLGIIGIGEDEYGYDLSGFFGGAQVGGMFQTGMFVLGIQGDVSWAHLSGDYTDAPPDVDTATIEWLASLTGRAGVAMDNVLLYALAGLAMAGGHSDYEGDVVDHTFTGYTIGVGAAVQLDDNWSIFAEYAYSGFGDEDVYYPEHDESYVYDLDLSTFKVGFNYRF